MANPFDTRGFNALEALMAGQQGYQFGNNLQRQRTQDSAREAAAESLASGGDSRNVLAQLIRGGLTPEATAISNMELARSNADWQKTYQGGMLDVARQNANRQEVPPQLTVLRAANIDPASPEGRKALFPRTDTPVSATDKKAIFEAENDVPRLQATIQNIERAKELNPSVFTGYTASTRGSLGTSGIPGANLLINRAGAEATAEWDQLMGGEAIKNMSETLKGASTDFEMKKFISIAADTSKPPQVREQAMNRFLSLANQELALRHRRSSELRSGDYFKPGGGQPQQGAAQPSGSAVIQQARDAIARGAPREAVIQRLRQNGIDASGL